MSLLPRPLFTVTENSRLQRILIKAKNVNAKAGGSDIEMAEKIFRYDKKISSILPEPDKIKRLVEGGKIKEAYFVISAEAIGRQSKKISAIFPYIKEIQKILPGANFISYPTCLGVYVFIKTLERMDNNGVFPPEALKKETRKEIIKKLKKRGISFV